MIKQIKNAFAKIAQINRGNVSQIFAIASVPLFLAIGLGIDLAAISNAKSELQSTADDAVLSIATQHKKSDTLEDIKNKISDNLKLKGLNSSNLIGDPILNSDGICITLETKKPTIFIKMVNKEDMSIRVNSCANYLSNVNLEIALVLDVSSSMIENARFAPMQAAAKEFINNFDTGSSSSSVSRISVVPFSSRVNIGMVNANKSWLKPLGTLPAIPNRWKDPDSVYGSNPSYTKALWLDGVTVDEYTATNYYWMGCIEPRSDIEILESGALGAYGLSDDTPSTAPFVAMDSNPESSMSFCPPPIVSLSDDYSYLSSAIDQLTSEGTTRLDAGMIAGWYTLSPKWKTTWEAKSAPEDYSNNVKKIVVFMTDGQMNTQYGQNSGKLDWRCNNMLSASSSSACNNAANKDLLDICASMKSAGIEIYTVAYGSDADKNFIKQCATDENHFYTAEAGKTDTNYIENIYLNIASRIQKSAIRVTK